MTHIRLCFSCLLIGYLSLTQLHGQTATAKVKIIIVDSFGAALKERITLTARNKEGMAKTIYAEGRTLMDLPEGLYSFEATSATRVPAVRYVTVRAPQTDVLFAMAWNGGGLRGDSIREAEWTVSGKVLAGRSSKPLVVKLSGIFLSASVETETAPDGTFSLVVSEQGMYRLSVIDTKSVFFERQLKVSFDDFGQVDVGTIAIGRTAQ